MASIFTKIINGEIPSVKVHEDDLTYAIMDINPIQPGQILVFPKQEVGTIWDLNDETYQALMASVKMAGKKLRQVIKDKARVGIIVEGLEVTDHAHIKVFPFSTAKEFHNQSNDSLKPTTEELRQLASKLAF